MDSKGFVEWLSGEAGVGWVVAIVTGLVWLISVLKRKAAQKIVFREVSKKSLVLISKTVGEKIDVTFEGTPVTRLSQLEADIFNSGLMSLAT